MNRTKIEWALNPDGTPGYTWNPITGCLNGCDYCYARKLANGRLRSRYIANNNLAPIYDDGAVPMHSATLLNSLDPFYPRFWPERLFEPMPNDGFRSIPNNLKPKGIFTCNMSDLFGIGIPLKWTHEVLKTIEYTPQHRFYLLTKQPQNLIKWSPFPDNCRVGASATNDLMAIDAHNFLDKVQAKVKYISFEPFLQWDLGTIDTERVVSNLDWVIIGAQTKPYKPPKWEWVHEIIEACVKAGIPYFLKNNLEPIVPKAFGGDGNLIQEMPEIWKQY